MRMRKPTRGKAKEYFRIYGGASGMSSSQPGDFAYIKNMYINYEGGGDAIESIPGFRRILRPGSEVHSLFTVGDGKARCLIAHAGDKLLRLPMSDGGRPEVICDLADGDSLVIPFGSTAFLLDGERLTRIERDGGVSEISRDADVVGCRCGAVYNGKLLLSGNEALPGRVICSSLTDGEMLFTPAEGFDGGVGGVNTKSLIAHNGYLWVFKTADDGSGSIICRREEENCYNVCAIFSNTVALSSPLSMGDELLFITAEGLMAVKNPTPSGGAEMLCRSEPIAKRLLREELNNAKLGSWLGYAVICLGGRIYLADPRADGREYGWYLLSEIGGYKGDKRVYRYLPYGEEGCKAHPNSNGIASGEIYSKGLEGGKMIYFSLEGELCYSVYPTEEMAGGELLPPTRLLCEGGFMCFATSDGSVYLFNNDKRGLPPQRISSAEDFDPEKYAYEYADRLHPDFYSFAGHAPSYEVTTCEDDFGLPGCEKTSVGNSLTLELKPLADSSVNLRITVDGRVNQDRKIHLNGKAASLQRSTAEGYGEPFTEECLTVTLSERVVGWRARKTSILADRYGSPFGIRSVCYRYGVKDSTKKQN